MSLATWRALCMDAADHTRLAGFWAAVLGLTPADPGDGSMRLDGEHEDQQLWVNPVPEAKTVKHRVHLDVEVGDLDGLEGLGATVLRPPGDDRHWWVMADVEGGEFCSFVRDSRPSLPGRLYELVVDCADAHAQADWWAGVLGIERERESQEHFAALEGGDLLPFDYLCFVPVPEPKRAKNRIHWDVVAPDVGVLVARGARVLREPDDEISWHILADPEGNEFCAFPTP
ncbi:MAG TPA: VOC family protein [Jiangellaceae bacterium]|nr:VOC family protein [Jiangellaceae bacterium]